MRKDVLYKKIIFIILLFFLFQNLYCETNSINYEELYKKEKLLLLIRNKKDPFNAALFSTFYCGVGEFYVGKYTEGSLLFLGETLCYLFNYGFINKLKIDYNVNSIRFDALNIQDKIILGASYFAYLSLKIFSIYYSYQSALEINKIIDEQINLLNLTVSDKNWNLLCAHRF